MTDQIELCTELHDALLPLFPNAFVHARQRTILGQTNIHLTFARSCSGWSSNIIENDPAFMGFMVHIERDGTANIERPCTHSNAMFRDHGLKFRKIKGNDESVAVGKLIEWFKKNQKIIDGTV